MDKKKIFIIQYITVDGEHEYIQYGFGRYKDFEDARDSTEVKHDSSGLDEKDCVMSFGDGLTETEVSSIKEVTEAELKIIRTFIILPDTTR